MCVSSRWLFEVQKQLCAKKKLSHFFLAMPVLAISVLICSCQTAWLFNVSSGWLKILFDQGTKGAREAKMIELTAYHTIIYEKKLEKKRKTL